MKYCNFCWVSAAVARTLTCRYAAVGRQLDIQGLASQMPSGAKIGIVCTCHDCNITIHILAPAQKVVFGLCACVCVTSLYAAKSVYTTKWTYLLAMH